jgi:signal transduction histidine kinase
MLSRLRSLRVRLTVLVTVAVGLALAIASIALVTSMSHSLVGDVKAAASAQVAEVSDAVARGQAPNENRTSPADLVTVIQIQDGQGKVLQTIPSVDSLLQRPISQQDLAKARARVQNAKPVAATSDDGLVVASKTVSTPNGTRTVVAVSRLGPITKSVDLVVTSLLIATPLLTIFVGVLTWFAVDRALRPIEAIRRRAEVISHSTLDERLPRPKTVDEVARLTTTLNEMLDRLDEGARRQREFVSDASHELRTPLAAMRADLEVSLASRNGADWQAMARRLLDDHRRMERLTSDLLLLARLDDATASPLAESVRLDEIVAGELPAVTRAELRVELAPVEITGVVPELVRLVRNLLDNADRHAAGRVDVQLVVDGDMAVLTVDDDGPGVPVAQRERVFDRFFRLDSSRARTSGGAGLGLAMVRRIAEGHGGTARIDTAPSGGARFAVRLPLSASAKLG